MTLRTKDTDYGEDYWTTLDGGLGYTDSVMWEDLAFIVKHLYGFSGKLETTRDIGGDVHHLDIGCASGYLSKHLRRRGVDSYGLDFSAWALDHADPYIMAFLRSWDITAEDELPDWSGVGFNLITCFETMEHIPEKHVPGVFSRIYDRLEPGGHALFAICTNDRPGWDSDPTHVTIYDRGWWMDQLLALPWKLDGHRYVSARSYHLFAEHSGTFTLEKPR